LDKRLIDKKSIDEIASELCPGVAKGREKIVRIIKMHKGGEYLLENYEWLGYNKNNIRNPAGKRSYKVPPKKSEMLFRPSLSIRKPSDEEYKKWLDSLTEVSNILLKLDNEIKNTTEGRYAWKVNELKKRTIEFRSLIEAKITDFGSKEETKISDFGSKDVETKRSEEKPKYNKIELHRFIFEKAREQINLVGQFDIKKISEELKIDVSTTQKHIKKMSLELTILIKRWQDERDKIV
jgi:hypothetical protein